MIYRVSKPSNGVNGIVELASSKSESNRVLIIQALCKGNIKINNLSNSDDTQVLKELLQSESDELNVGAAGTTMRFSTAYLSITPGSRILTGSKRMQQRPIGLLVDALRSLGANIKYMENEGYPPLQIEGNPNLSSEVELDPTISSQFVTALLLIAPSLPNGLKIRFNGEISSRPYMNMTLKIMEYFGVQASWEGNSVTVEAQTYMSKEYTIDADWSAASYWFEMVALAESADIKLKGFKEFSLQGDAMVKDIFAGLGVKSTYEDGTITIEKIKPLFRMFGLDFIDCPDIAQTVGAVVASIGVKSTFRGLKSLIIKETDRIAALQTELGKFGVDVVDKGEGVIEIESES